MSAISERGRTVHATARAVVAALIMLVASPGLADQGKTGPFATFIGSWSGTGSVTFANGLRERLRCRVSYKFDRSKEMLQQDMRCASDSYKFDLKAEAREEAGTVSGRWTEVTRSASGLLRGRVADGRIKASVRHPGFTAELILATRGDRQSITIRSGGNEPVTVSITLSRAQ